MNFFNRFEEGEKNCRSLKISNPEVRNYERRYKI